MSEPAQPCLQTLCTCLSVLSPAELSSRGSPGKKCSPSSGASCASRMTVCSRRISRSHTVIAPAPPPAAIKGTPTPVNHAFTGWCRCRVVGRLR